MLFRRQMSAQSRMSDFMAASEMGHSPPRCEFETSMVIARWSAQEDEDVQALSLSGIIMPIEPSLPIT